MFSKKKTNEEMPSGSSPSRSNKGSQEVCSIAAGTEIKGSIETAANLRLEGKVQGNVKCQGRLFMSASGKITGDIRSESAALQGNVEGDIFSSDLLHLHSGSLIKGDIKAKRLVVEDGARFDGECSMG